MKIAMITFLFALVFSVNSSNLSGSKIIVTNKQHDNNFGYNQTLLETIEKRCCSFTMGFIAPASGQTYTKGLTRNIIYGFNNLCVDVEFDGVLYYYLEGVSVNHYSMIVALPNLNNPYSWLVPTNIASGTYRIIGVVNWRCPKGAGDWQGYSFTSANFNIN